MEHVSNDERLAAARGEFPDAATPDGLESASRALAANPVLSRRSFVSATAVVGALTFLGSVSFASGTTVNAYADEGGNTHFSIYVLNREEVPIMAMRETETGKVAVGGVTVTVTSLFNQEQLSATTGDDGFAVINIRALSFESDDDSSPFYSFYGEVLASAEGCRDFYLPQAFILSGALADDDGVRANTIEIPVEADDGTAYLRYVTLDDVDALHNGEPAAVGDYNDIDHDFAVQVATANASASVQVALLIDGKEVARQAATRDAAAPNFATTTFTDKYLSIIEPGQKVKIWFSAEGETAKAAELPIEFQQAIVPNAGLDNSMALTAGFNPQGRAEARLGVAVSFPFGIEDTFYVGIPGVPVDIFNDPSGNFGFSAALDALPICKDVNGDAESAEEFLKRGGGRGLHAGLAQLRNTLSDDLASGEQAYAGLGKRNSFCGTPPITKTVTAQCELTALGLGSFENADDDGREFAFDGIFFFKGGLDGSVGIRIPLFFGFGIYLAFDWKLFMQGDLSAGVAFNTWFQDLQWNHHCADGAPKQYVYVFSAEAGISVGVGRSDAFGLAVRGYNAITLNLKYDCGAPDEKHFLGALGWFEMNMQLIVQSILGSKTLAFPPVKATFVDLGDTSTALETANQQISEMLKSIDLSDMKMFTQSALGEVAEFEATMNDDDALASAAAKTLTGSDGNVVIDAASPATYTRTRLAAADGDPVLVAAGPASAPGFASPYAAIAETGKLKAGFTGTSDLAKTGTQDDFANLTTYNPRLGLVPTEQKLIYKDVYSNARLRTVCAYPRPNVEPERHTVMARLVTAKIPCAGEQAHSRSRVCLRSWDADKHAFGGEQIVDFAVDGVAAENRYDVDFDFEVHVDPGIDGLPDLTYATLAITSLVIEGDEEISYDECAARQFVTIVVWCLDAELPVRVASLKSKLDEGVATYHPRAVIQKSIGSGGSTGWVQGRRCSFYYYHDKAGSEEESGIYVTTLNLLGLVVRDFDLALAENTNVEFPVSNRTLIGGTFEVASEEDSAYISEGVYDKRLHTLLAWSGMNGDAEASFVRSFRFDDENMDCDDQVAIDDVASFSRHQHEASGTVFTYFKTSSVVREKKNNVVSFDANARKIVAGEVDGYSNESRCIATADGKRMYAVHVSDGVASGSALTDDVAALVEGGAQFCSTVHYNEKTGANFGGSSTTNTVAEPVYQLLESRWIESLGAYHEFYPIARLAFPPDSIDVLTCTGGAREFVMSSITDAEEAKSDIYQVSVPDVLAVQCEGVKPESPFAAPGGTVGFYVDASNVGNALITGFTVIVTDEAGSVVHNQEYSDLREYYQPSAENHRTVRDENETPVLDENGMVASEAVEDIRDASGILWPGFRRTYRFSFIMPEGYEGSTEFQVQLSNPRSNPYADDSSAQDVLASATAAKASLAALAGADGEPATLRESADHLSWLNADEFSESLFGASVQQVVDPRRRPLMVEAEVASDVASGFSALPAKYVVEGSGEGEGDSDDKSGGGSGAGGRGSGSGPGSDDSGSGGGKSLAKSGDASGAACAMAAAVAVGAAGVAVKAAKESAACAGDGD